MEGWVPDEWVRVDYDQVWIWSEMIYGCSLDWLCPNVHVEDGCEVIFQIDDHTVGIVQFVLFHG